MRVLTWEIISGLIALIGVGISVGKIVHNNTEALTRLSLSVDMLTQRLHSQSARLETLTGRVGALELRLARGGREENRENED